LSRKGVLLPPYPPPTPLPEGVLPEFQGVDALIDDILYKIVELQISLEKIDNPDVEVQIKYHRALMEYWCDVYLQLYGKPYEILIC